MYRLTLAFGPLVLALALAACSNAGATQSSASAGTPGPNDVAIAARDMQFVERDLRVRAGTAFAIWFANQDGAPHNISIRDASGATVLKGDIFGGPATRTYAVPALAAGSYGFVCDLHPDMTGSITAS